MLDKHIKKIEEDTMQVESRSDKEKKKIQDQDITYMDTILFDAFERIDSIDNISSYTESKAKEFTYKHLK